MKDQAPPRDHGRTDDSLSPSEKALRECEQTLKDVQQLARIGTWRYDITNGRLWWSDELFRIFEMSAADGPLSPDLLFARVHPDDRECFKAQVASRKSHRSDYRILLPGGTIKYIHEEVRAERNGQGAPVVLFGTAQDITERKQTEDALRESEQRYRAIVDSQAEFVVRYLPGGLLTFVNDTLCRYVNMRREDLLGKSYYPFMHPDDREQFVRNIEALDRKTPSLVAEARVVLPDGRVVWHRWTHQAIFDGAGTVLEYQSSGRDVTDLKRTEEKLLESEERFRAVFENSRDAIGVSLVGRHVFANPAYLTLFGLPPGTDLRDRPILDLIAPESHARIREYVKARANRQPVPSFYEVRGLRADGTSFDMEVSASVYREHGRDHTLVMLRDVTDRKRAEQEIAERGTRLQQILDTASVAIFLLDMEGRITLANRRMADMFGCTVEDLIGTEYLDRLPPEERAKRQPHFQAMLTGAISSVDFERTFRRMDGTEFWGHMTGSRLHDAAGGELGLIGILADITRRKETEDGLQRSQKLESIATLAGGIAHDFNNLLQGVFGYISMAKFSIDQRDKALAKLEQAEKALHASVNLSNQLLTFSKGGKPVKEVIDLRPVIESSVQLALSGSRVDHVLSIDQDLLPVDADTGQITQVIQNIVLNADQAMPLGGRIEIAAHNRAAASVPGFGSTVSGDLVEISVKDSGTGIPEEHLPRIFDPYFTTKDKGSGLGLATSYSIIVNHGGVITVCSALGAGSTFSIYLPASAKAPAAAPADVRPQPGRRGRVLLMDDESVVRMVAADLLHELGHEVAFAENGEFALAQYRNAVATGKPFDIVILDLTVRGGMGGAETLKQLRALDPRVKAVVSSGYSDDTVIANYRDHGFLAFLKKPYNIDELEDVLNVLLS